MLSFIETFSIFVSFKTMWLEPLWRSCFGAISLYCTIYLTIDYE